MSIDWPKPFRGKTALRFQWIPGEKPRRAQARGSIGLQERAAMPKNKGKGGKNRRRGKNDNEENKRELEFKEDGQGACWSGVWRRCEGAETDDGACVL